MRDGGGSDEGTLGVRFGPLTDSLGFLLRLGQLSAFEAYYDEIGALGVRPGEMSVLFLVAENPGVRQGVLASSLRIKRAHMTKMIRAMEDAGLVHRTVPEDDRRSVELWLTAAGRARVAELTGPVLAHESRAQGRLDQREAAQLKRLLRAYLNIPEDPSGPGHDPLEESGS